MRNIGLIILVVFIFLSVGFYAQYKNEIPKPIPTPSPIDVDKKVPDVAPVEYIEIGPGESARVHCGEGNIGTQVTFKEGSFAGNIGLGGQADITAKVSDTKGQPAGGLVEWTLFYRGTLHIEGCSATFMAPDSIGTAYSTSANISARVVPNTTPPTPSPAGEGGPRNAGQVASTKVTILSGAKATCFDPAGVAISINSVSTTRNVQIWVDTPRVAGRLYNGRNVTVRDGVGTYVIEIFVDGGLYGNTTSQVSACQLPTVKF